MGGGGRGYVTRRCVLGFGFGGVRVLGSVMMFGCLPGGGI